MKRLWIVFAAVCMLCAQSVWITAFAEEDFSQLDEVCVQEAQDDPVDEQTDNVDAGAEEESAGEVYAAASSNRIELEDLVLWNREELKFLPLHSDPEEMDWELPEEAVGIVSYRPPVIADAPFPLVWNYDSIDPSEPGRQILSCEVLLPDGYWYADTVLEEVPVLVYDPDGPAMEYAVVMSFENYIGAIPPIPHETDPEALPEYFNHISDQVVVYTASDDHFFLDYNFDIGKIDTSTIGTYYPFTVEMPGVSLEPLGSLWLAVHVLPEDEVDLRAVTYDFKEYRINWLYPIRDRDSTVLWYSIDGEEWLDTKGTGIAQFISSRMEDNTYAFVGLALSPGHMEIGHAYEFQLQYDGDRYSNILTIDYQDEIPTIGSGGDRSGGDREEGPPPPESNGTSSAGGTATIDRYAGQAEADEEGGVGVALSEALDTGEAVQENYTIENGSVRIEELAGAAISAEDRPAAAAPVEVDLSADRETAFVEPQPPAATSVLSDPQSSGGVSVVLICIAVLGGVIILLFRRMSTRWRTALLCLTAAALAAGLFLLCDQFDNKYTQPSPRAVDGVVVLDSDTLRQYPVLHLVYDWDIYRDRLLSPDDIAAGAVPDETVYIGQYGGFEGADHTRSPHGSATYRLVLLLPEEERSYSMELPEIYSAYDLYINGVHVRQMGDPAPDRYRPVTGSDSITFLASGETELVFAVADHSHFYSGMVYPPAFGLPDAISALLTQRLILRTAICAVALFLGALFLAVGFFYRRIRCSGTGLLALYSLVCLAFAFSTIYPVIKTLYPGGMVWYRIENAAYCVLLLLVLLVQQSLCPLPKRYFIPAAGVGVLICVCSLLVPAVMGDSLFVMLGYSRTIQYYTWACAGYLTASSVYSIAKGYARSRVILVGVVVFDTALAVDRLLPLFEPIRFGWFIEVAGAVLVLSFGAVIASETAARRREQIVLQRQVEDISHLVELQRAHYPLILEGIEQARAARHDLRHHMQHLQRYAAAEDFAGLRDYLEVYERAQPGEIPSFCDNFTIDSLLRDFAHLAQRHAIRFDAKVDAGEDLPVSDADLVGVLGNLLENAVEAGLYVPREDRWMEVRIRALGGTLCISVRNSFDGQIQNKRGKYLSRKRKGTGVGTAAVKTIAERYNGSVQYRHDVEQKVFSSDVVLSLGAALNVIDATL